MNNNSYEVYNGIPSSESAAASKEVIVNPI